MDFCYVFYAYWIVFEHLVFFYASDTVYGVFTFFVTQIFRRRGMIVVLWRRNNGGCHGTLLRAPSYDGNYGLVSMHRLDIIARGEESLSH